MSTTREKWRVVLTGPGLISRSDHPSESKAYDRVVQIVDTHKGQPGGQGLVVNVYVDACLGRGWALHSTTIL